MVVDGGAMTSPDRVRDVNETATDTIDRPLAQVETDGSITPRPRSRGQQAMASLGHEHRIESDATNDDTANACASSRTPLRDDIAERAGDDIAGSSNLTHTPIPDDKSNTTPR